jgi:wyosine [tRNA(Phe)-imidazoG37] synthetase (radical SAM superfamily)
MKYIYGPIPSRRLGKSLGVSPIKKKTCNLSCVYCQLGLTDNMTNSFTNDYKVNDILTEVKEVLQQNKKIDVITIVGEGEPTLYEDLDILIKSIKAETDIPVAVITNGTKLNEEKVFRALLEADLVLPSLDAYDEMSFKRINRPHKELNYHESLASLIEFSKVFQGQLWLEIMICKGYNDSDEAIVGFTKLLKKIKHQRLYINSPVRPPAIKTVKPVDHLASEIIARKLGGINIDVLADPEFYSNIKDDYEAILSIIRRHPMNQFEINCFLDSREVKNKEEIFINLRNNELIEIIKYKSYDTFRMK